MGKVDLHIGQTEFGAFLLTISSARNVIIFLFLWTLFFAVHAQAQRVTNSMNVHVVSILPDGRILSPMNVPLGRFTTDGNIVDAQNRTRHGIDRDGNIRSAANVLLGRIRKDGRVYDARNRWLGTITGQLRLTDNRNVLRITAKAVRQDWLAVGGGDKSPLPEPPSSTRQHRERG